MTTKRREKAVHYGTMSQPLCRRGGKKRGGVAHATKVVPHVDCSRCLELIRSGGAADGKALYRDEEE